MQAITTKVLPPTNTKGLRIKASCDRGSKTYPWDYSLPTRANHAVARIQLVNIFAIEDKKRNGTFLKTNSWLGEIVMGEMQNGVFAHVFIK